MTHQSVKTKHQLFHTTRAWAWEYTKPKLYSSPTPHFSKPFFDANRAKRANANHDSFSTAPSSTIRLPQWRHAAQVWFSCASIEISPKNDVIFPTKGNFPLRRSTWITFHPSASNGTRKIHQKCSQMSASGHKSSRVATAAMLLDFYLLLLICIINIKCSATGGPDHSGDESLFGKASETPERETLTWF